MQIPKESRTFNNLSAAFAGESMAYMKYKLFEEKAKQQGYEKVADIFKETAHNEKAHAELWFKLLNNGEMPATDSNLKDAQGGENFEWTQMYKKFAEEARAEGFDRVAALFEMTGKVEEHHDKRYTSYIQKLDENKMFHAEKQVKWKCLNCGHELQSLDAPGICPLCGYKQGFFEEEKGQC